MGTSKTALKHLILSEAIVNGSQQLCVNRKGKIRRDAYVSGFS